MRRRPPFTPAATANLPSPSTFVPTTWFPAVLAASPLMGAIVITISLDAESGHGTVIRSDAADASATVSTLFFFCQ
jgi:hypothetical protein